MLSRVEDRHDAWVPQARQGPQLGRGPLSRARVTPKVGEQNLDRDLDPTPFCARVSSPVDHPHPAAAQLGNDRVGANLLHSAILGETRDPRQAAFRCSYTPLGTTSHRESPMNPTLHESATKGGAVVAGVVAAIATGLAGQAMGLNDDLVIGLMVGAIVVGLVGGYVLVAKLLDRAPRAGSAPPPGPGEDWPADASPDAKRLFAGPRQAVLAMVESSKVFALSGGLQATDNVVAATQRALGLYTAILPALYLRPEEIMARKDIYLDLTTLLCMDLEDHWDILKVSSKLPSSIRDLAQRFAECGDPQLKAAGDSLIESLP